jgi:hypothetical protein
MATPGVITFPQETSSTIRRQAFVITLTAFQAFTAQMTLETDILSNAMIAPTANQEENGEPAPIMAVSPDHCIRINVREIYRI